MAHGAPLLSRAKAILVKVETDKGADPTPTAFATVYDLVMDPTGEFIQRDPNTVSMGHDAGVRGMPTGRATFSVELRGIAGATFDLGLLELIQGCGFGAASPHATVSSPDTQETVTIYAYEGGVLKILTGAMGTYTLTGTAANRMMMNFEFLGIWNAVTDQAVPAQTHTGVAPVLLKGATMDIGSWNPKINEFSLAMNNVIVPREDVTVAGGAAYFVITDRDPVITIDAEQELVTNDDGFDIWLNTTEAAASLVVANSATTFTWDFVLTQLKDMSGGERGGKMINNITLQCNTSVAAGNDDVIITTAAV